MISAVALFFVAKWSDVGVIFLEVFLTVRDDSATRGRVKSCTLAIYWRCANAGVSFIYGKEFKKTGHPLETKQLH
jgi:hypothetical protein